MSNTYIFCPETNGFYPIELKSIYEQAGTWPVDGVEVSEEEHAKLLEEQSNGLMIVLSSTGELEAVQREQDEESLISYNTFTKTKLLREVSDLIAPLVDAEELGSITATEKKKLLQMKMYRIELSRITDMIKPSFPEKKWDKTKK